MNFYKGARTKNFSDFIQLLTRNFANEQNNTYLCKENIVISFQRLLHRSIDAVLNIAKR
jgi:hypothetical protein